MSKRQKRIILIDVVSPLVNLVEAEKFLMEMMSLINTYRGGEVIKIIQRRAHPHPGTYIGSGKAEEVAEMVKNLKVDIVILNAIADSTQLYKLLQMFWRNNPNIEVWDRIDLILHIFDKHARTAESKLQIELARMRHMGPRMYGLSEQLGRQTGGIGGRGVGETNIELMKRHWRDEMKKTKDKLDGLLKTHENQIKRRREIGFQTISIVGYTNAGKTTLFNALTGKKKRVENVLFATLESYVGKLYLPNIKKEVLISDTIGFIQNLPTLLITAFKSTLMESVHAEILLHVIDASDPDMYKKIETVENILEELGRDPKNTIYVFNKTENLHESFKKELSEEFKPQHPIFISAKTGEGVEKLIYFFQDAKKIINNYSGL
ncbi:GTPase HflX [Candidatus Roizmanbacteria bacterium RIFCSPLOWO2_01_FULL_38_12]|uniref:GTPase HflX n=1 Tax=Candidatus Roizmanbacteria bacterium RIFCSPLOWO2_01_FULL_38_12 TaxID=1802061 RepID=A0A1F7IYS8_9BACT|nr:MAG: GTPase HflX [Candidatus Roizmanbacteria bacterium RIFCSPLOWO2_01_FULL_38_12]